MTEIEIRRRSARFRNGMTILFAVLAVLVTLERLSFPLVEIGRYGFNGATLRGLGVSVALAVPHIFYLVALWGIRKALADFANGDFFAPTVAAMLDRVGIWLAAGAVTSVFLVPLAERALGFGPGYFIALDVSGLVLGAVGLSLTLVGRVLTRAAALQTELDEMF